MRNSYMEFAILLTMVSLSFGTLFAQQNAPAPAPAGPARAPAGRAPAGRQANAAPPPPMRLISTSVADGVQMAAKYTCSDPEAVSPGLKWTDAPRGTESFALIVHDMEPRPRKGVDDILHWMVWDIPGTANQLPEAVLSKTADLPDGSHQTNGNPGQGGVTGYRPPCPPQNVPVPHHYAFEVFALDERLNLADGATRADVLKAMDGHILGHASLVAVLSR